ncbi:MAG: penicillin acylase family protein, partial [Planctomycetota bacterium]
YLFAPTRREIRSSVAATIYSVWRGQFIRRVVDGTMADLAAAAGLPSLPSPPATLALSATRNLLENFDERGGVGQSGVDFFVVPDLPNAQDRLAYVILRSLADALDRLAGESFAPAFGGSTRQRDYRWGRLHRVVLASPLGDPFNLPSTLAGFPPPLDDLPGYPVDGGFNTVDASTHSARAQSFNEFMFSAGPVVRYVGELGRFRIRSESSLPGGPSGVVGSPLYGSLLTRWLTNETYPVRTSRFQVAIGAQERIRLIPQ